MLGCFANLQRALLLRCWAFARASSSFVKHKPTWKCFARFICLLQRPNDCIRVNCMHSLDLACWCGHLSHPIRAHTTLKILKRTSAYVFESTWTALSTLRYHSVQMALAGACCCPQPCTPLLFFSEMFTSGMRRRSLHSACVSIHCGTYPCFRCTGGPAVLPRRIRGLCAPMDILAVHCKQLPKVHAIYAYRTTLSRPNIGCMCSLCLMRQCTHERLQYWWCMVVHSRAAIEHMPEGMHTIQSSRTLSVGSLRVPELLCVSMRSMR